MAKAKSARARRKNRTKQRTQTSPREKLRRLKSLLEEIRPIAEGPRAEEAYRRMQEHFSDFGHHPAWCEMMGLVCLNTGRIEEAEFYLLQALKREPGRATAHSYLGFVHLETADYLKSIEHHRKAIEHSPNTWAYYTNLSQVLERMGLYEQALAALTTAFRLTGGREPRVLWELGNLYLCFGRIEEGWKLYEAGFGCRKRTPPLPRNENYWGGEDISKNTILVWREFGIGDEIRNAGLYHDLVAAAGHVIIECEPRLVSIFARNFPKATVIAENMDHPPDTERPEYDVHSGQFSLHYHFRKNIEAYRAAARPDGFLAPDPDRLAEWRRRFAALGAKAVVGISWTSGLRFKQREHNYFSLDALGELLTTPDVAFVNLFYGEAEEEIRAAEEKHGITIHRWPDVDLKNDLETVLAMTKALDLVITAPTSNADIGGAVGTETWTILPPRHYIRLGTDHVPQMPSVRVFDRRHDEPWGPTLKRITGAFHEWLGAREAGGLRARA